MLLDVDAAAVVVFAAAFKTTGAVMERSFMFVLKEAEATLKLTGNGRGIS